MTTNKIQPANTLSPPDKKPGQLIPLIMVFLTVLIWIIAVFVPHARLWGVNLLFYTSPKNYFLCLGILVCILMILSEKIPIKTVRGIRSAIIAGWKNQHQIIRLILAGLCALALFWSLRDRTKLLGDSILRIGELGDLSLIKLLSTSAAEPLDYIIHFIFYKFVCAPFGLSSAFCYEIIAYLSGLHYLWGAYAIARQLRSKNISFQFTFLFLLGWGGIQMYFGYAEEYGLAASALLIFIYFVIRNVNKGGDVIPVAVIFLIGFFLHNLLLILFPSIVYMLLIEFKTNKKKAMAILASVILPVAIWLALSYASKERGAFLLPDSGTEPGYTLWSGAHLFDIFNELLLMIPAFLVIISLQKKGGFPGVINNRLRLTIWLSALPALIVLAFIDPQLGMARDWDLFALPLLTLYIALFLGVDWSKVDPWLKITVVLIMVGFTFIWVQVNADEKMAIRRYENILPLDYTRGRYGYDRLGFYYVSRGLLPEAETAYKEAIRIKPHPRTLLNLAYVQADLGKKEEAIANLKDLVKLEPLQPVALYELGLMYSDIGQYQNALDYFVKFQATSEGKANPDLAKMINKLQLLIIKESTN
jgi:tetratricopeptide (TPR) repeat protein